MTGAPVTLAEAAVLLGCTRQHAGALARRHGAVVRARRPLLVDVERIRARQGLTPAVVAERLRDVAMRDLGDMGTKRDAGVLLLAFKRLCPDAKPLPGDVRLLRVMAGLE